MIVDGNGQDLFRPLLADDVLVEDFLDLLRLRQRVMAGFASILEFLADDVVTEF
jgi:hypothetical protein